MASVIGTGAHPKALWPGIYEWWGRQYKDHGEECLDLFDKKSSSKAYEETVEATGFGIAPVKSEGGKTKYVTEQQGTVTRATHVAYSQGYIVTYEEQKDNLYAVVSKRRAEANAFSMYTTRETVAANVYNRAFNSSFVFGDGKEIIANDHPTLSGDQSNILTVNADLSETAIEDLIIQISNTKNSKGLRIALQPMSLHVATANIWNANRILTSTLQNDTAQNAVNVIKSTSAIPNGIKVNHYFTDADAWFIRTNVPAAGMTLFDREPTIFSQDNDFDTDNMKAKAYMRFSLTVGDFRSLFGSPGA